MNDGLALSDATGWLRGRVEVVAAAAVVAATVVVSIAAAIAGDWAAVAARASLRAELQGDLTLFQANLVSELERFQLIPFVLAEDDEVAKLLGDHANGAIADRVNRRLERIAATARASAIYVMDRDGTALAASNWNTARSFVRENFAYRPYFQAALNGQVGRDYALGTTSHVPGNYIAYPVRAPATTGTGPPTGGVIGVVVVKVGIDDVEAIWARAEGRVAVTDPDGVIVITNEPYWRFRTLRPLSPVVRQRLEARQQYPGQALEALPLVEHAGGARDEIVVMEPTEDDTEGGIRARRYLDGSVPIPNTSLTLHVLLGTETVRQRAADAAVIAGFGAMFLLLALFLYCQRRASFRQRLEDQRQAREELERQVALRTADLTAANTRLREEARERERAEEVLKAAQNELVQAAKLAALGEMSAGIAHEINQPLAAIRAFADNGRTLLERGRVDVASANLGEIAQLTERMAQITRQLKSFARKASGTVEAISVDHAIGEALALVTARVRAERVEVIRVGDASTRYWAMAENVRLQQVLINLFRNALDAMRGQPLRLLAIDLRAEGGAVVVAVSDTGAGIAEADLLNLFEPFFTTKTGEDGLGLGLSISYGIIRDFGGTLSASNRPGGGATFTISLPIADPQTGEHRP